MRVSKAQQLPPITEKQFAAQVVKLARMFGWRVYHTWLSVRSEPGFPDLVLVRGERLIFAELKSEAGKLTAVQEDWLAALRETWQPVWVWRPSDLERIAEILR